MDDIDVDEEKVEDTEGSPETVEQRSNLKLLESDKYETNFSNNQSPSFYPQSSTWQSSEDQIPPQSELNVAVVDSNKNEIKTDKQDTSGDTFRNSQDFLQLLSQLNQTLETLKFQEKVYNLGKESFIFLFYYREALKNVERGGLGIIFHHTPFFDYFLPQN